MRYDREYIQAKLKLSPRWRAKALLMLYSQQTEQERALGAVLYANERGFTEPDAASLTATAKLLAKGASLTRGTEIMLAKRLPKYWRQITQSIAQAQAKRVLKQTASYVELRNAKAQV